MTVIAYKIGYHNYRVLWGFNIPVQPWTHDGKNDVIIGSLAMPENVPKVLPAKVEKQLLLLSKEIEKLQKESQRIVERAYPKAPLWKNQKA